MTVTGAATTVVTAAADGQGSVGAAVTQTKGPFGYDVRIEPAPAEPDAPGLKAPAVAFTATGAALSGDLRLDRLRTVALSELWAFLVAHPDRASLAAGQAELKDRIRAILPVALGGQGRATLSNLVVDTRLGRFGLGELGEHYAFGAAAGGGASFSLRASGLTLPDGLLPPWAAPLVPTGFDVSERSGPLGLSAAALVAVDALDLSRTPPLTDADVSAISAALVPGGVQTVHILPSSVSTALMTLRFEADIALAKPMPTGSATIRAIGLDRTLDALRTGAPGDPTAAQAAALLLGAKAMARAEGPDSYAWHIETGPAGTIAVNGVTLGGAPAAAPRTAPKPAAPQP